MTRTILLSASILLLALLLVAAGCDKEKIVETTEYIEQTEYIELPPDTVFQVDTIVVNDSIPVQQTDTVYVHDTVETTTTVHDTTWLYDTIEIVNTVHDTTYILDTIAVVVSHFDTVYVTDTVTSYQCSPNEYLAIEALQQYANSIVIDFIYSEFGYDDGWVFYLSTVQSDLTAQSSTVYDIYGYIDYWTPDWEAYYPLEYYYRMTFTGGDPADPNNWDLGDPPAAAPGDIQPGLKMTPPEKVSSRSIR